jgi:hypothetical protein
VALVIKPTENINELGKQIATEFVARLKGLRLTEAEQALVDRAAVRVSASAVLSPGAPKEVQDRLAMDRDNAIAVMANVLVAKSIQAEQLFRQTAFDVLTKAIQIAIGVALAA